MQVFRAKSSKPTEKREEGSYMPHCLPAEFEGRVQTLSGELEHLQKRMQELESKLAVAEAVAEGARHA